MCAARTPDEGRMKCSVVAARALQEARDGIIALPRPLILPTEESSPVSRCSLLIFKQVGARETQVAVQLAQRACFQDNPAATPSCCAAPWQGWRFDFLPAAEAAPQEWA